VAGVSSGLKSGGGSQLEAGRLIARGSQMELLEQALQ